MQIRDIIDVPVVETVVRLDDASDCALREGLVSEFVLTRQVERNLSMIAQSIKEKNGRGHFLVGPYGSGKSHFLSFVSLILSGEAKCRTGCSFKDAVSEHRFMPLRVSLVNTRNDRRLEDAILAEAERYMRALGVKINLTKRSRFIDYADSVVRSIDSAGMDAYLISHNLPVWEKLMGDPDKAAVSAWGYIKTLSGHPGMSEVAPAELLSQITKSAKQLGFEGVVIVIDELSEFLRSKPSRVALNEDARYLQLMGEVAQAEKLLIIASLQEAIEQAGDIARDVIAKIKDRYPVKMSLDEQHIRDLIDGRLIRKKDGAREHIRDVWLKYTECLPQFKIDFEDFYRIYPIHPATIRYLEGLKMFLSAHRGVVDFIVSQVRGDAKRGVKGLFDATAETLVTVDMIYEHFKDRIREDNRFAEFDTLVRRDLNSAAKKIFTDEDDRNLAIRACDVLILNKIAELERPKSVSELTAILLTAASSVSSKANEQFLADVILSPLLKESLFLRATHDKDAGKRIFDVSLERDSAGLLQKEIERVLSAVPLNDRRVARTVFDSVSSELPLREAQNGNAGEMIVQWRGTQRRGTILWAESVSFAEVEQKINNADHDFSIVLCPPDFKLSTEEPIPERAIYWIPEFDKNEIAQMRKYYAIKTLSVDGGVEKAAKEDAIREIEADKTSMSGVIESGFKRGKFVRGGHIEERAFAFVQTAGFLERFAARPIIEILKGIHPKFLEVAPEIEFISRRTLMPLIDAIIIPGKITMALARKNNSRTMIEGVLIPMGLARVQGPLFVMQTDPAKSSLIKDTLNAVNKDNKIIGVMQYLRRGHYGLTIEMAELLIVSLVHAGLVEIKKGGRRIPSGIVSLSHVEEAEDIYAGELLQAELKKRLFTSAYLTEGIDSGAFSLVSQREVWERLVSARDRLKKYSSETVPALLAVSKYPVFDNFDFAKVKAIIDNGLEAVSCVEESKGAAKGLAQYLSIERPELGGILKTADVVERFVTNDSERVIRIADYLREIPEDMNMPPVEQAFADVKNFLASLTDIVLQDKVGDIYSAFNGFLETYIAWYADEHAHAFPKERFKAIRELLDTKEMQALSFISGIAGIHLVDEASVIKKRISAGLSLDCGRAVSQTLRLRPKCACGFTPGKPVKFEDAKSVKKTMENGLKEAVSALSSPAVLEKLISRITALRDIDSSKAGLLEDIFHKLRGGMETSELVRLMTRDTAGLLDEALKREVTVIKRKAKDLTERLSGRRLPPERIREIFEKWLGECGKGDVVVDLNEDGDECLSCSAHLAAWIKDHGLDDAPARLALVIPRELEAVSTGGELIVDDARLKKMIELTGLINAGGEEILRILGRERRCHAFAISAVKQFSDHLIDGWRPKEKIVSGFDDVKKVCEAVIAVTETFCDAQIGRLIRSETGREYSMSFLNESHFRHNYPSVQTIEKMRSIMLQQIELRDHMFANIPAWPVKFNEMIERYSNAVFLFIDAARWDIVAKIDERIKERSAGIVTVEENWYRVDGANTSSWQNAVFGTSDIDSISAMFKKHGFRYFADAERLDVRKRIKEEADDSNIWLNVGVVDRLAHASSAPLHQLIDEAVSAVSDVVMDILGIVKKGRRLVLLTDHGFSETKFGKGRYCHDPSRPSDAVSAMMVYEKG